jgi:hypothetical protein
VVPGGGPSLDGMRWIACRPGFFLPVRVLSRLFRRLFLQNLQDAFDAGKLVARFSQIEGYKCLSLTRALDVVKCQLALV